MSPPALRRYDASWQRRNVLALVAACTLAGGWLAGRSWARRLAVGPQPATDSARVEEAAEKINPNTASVASLQRLPGIGPARAQAIVDYRRAHGPEAFRRLGDLQRVEGIGPVTPQRIAPYLDLPEVKESLPLAGAGG